jgi:hypothetical protein
VSTGISVTETMHDPIEPLCQRKPGTRIALDEARCEGSSR